MIDPARLLSLARELSDPPGRGAPQQVKLRRAISSAYYALFHFLLIAATDLLVGQNERVTPRYLIVYRSFDHTPMRDVCNRIKASPEYEEAIRSCAATFVDLQKLRHTADYDPSMRFSLSDARAAVSKSTDAMRDFAAVADSPSRRMFLTSLHFRQRG